MNIFIAFINLFLMLANRNTATFLLMLVHSALRNVQGYNR